MSQELDSLLGKRQRQRRTLITLIVILAIYCLAAYITKFSSIKTIQTFPEAFTWIAKHFMPNESSFSKVNSILDALSETILMAVAATVTAALFAFVLALLGAQSTQLDGKVGQVLGFIARLMASFFRNVPEVVWAMVFLLSFGQSATTGYLALFFVTVGTLTRAFIESIDEASHQAVEALQATGASYLQVVGQAIIPSSIAQFISWVLYMVETNIRSSTLIGILAGSGIGHIFNLYYRRFRYPAAGLVILFILISIFVIEGVSNFVRRKVL
ncbi:phosphonate ABC transporter, permease protein PhnE [Vaginisenegalia massiliensis]|uniref:phosphonate ABC transporter, permease protein PhnE n=1 Tax=Vaginisenegalia massiliensis TaxID=2058294 RepID=UPI000F526AC1|nr:phosphonate ABC transporter, permease protein PhnE [Vaginisenegalia massiliensis]